MTLKKTKINYKNIMQISKAYTECYCFKIDNIQKSAVV